MAKKRFHFPWFYLVMVLYAAAFLTATYFGLQWLWGYMEGYEASQPEHAIEQYMAQLENEDLYAASQALISQLDSKLISPQDCQAMIDQAVSGGITYARNRKESTSDKHVYMLLSGEQTIGRVVTQPGAADERGFRIWSATEESFDFSFLMGAGDSITVPHTMTVTVNGYALDESYITKSNIPYESLRDYYDDFEGLPYMVTYETPGVWGTQEWVVTDESGAPVTIDADTDLEAFLPVCTQEELDRIHTFATDFIDQYMVFISCSNAVRKQEYKRLIDFIADGAPLEARMYEAMDGLQWVTRQNAELISMTVNSCLPLGESRYLCDLTYVSETTKYAGRTEDVTNTKIILVQNQGKLLAESMQNY